ncbi:MAG TPA: histidinol dehydrogenase [Candidatus Methylacidiphilales bacterium]|jgi:histidinol dehydrogenase|nr:histidinol dehydrogenase [Candidatus Methylacidiphilales bacterium]
MSTKPWRVLRYNQPQFARQIAVLNRHGEPSASRQAAVAEIISTVRKDGDDALVRYTKKFDGVDLARGGLLLPARAPKPAPNVIAAVDYAIKNVRGFSRLKKPRNWSRLNREGARVGEKFDPLERIGVYVPGGTAPLVSTALMTVPLAKEAGVREIVVATPPPVNETLAYALRTAGATEVYQVGGAQAIAALAYGTPTIARVCKIFGPGNAWVVEAKRQVVGACAIDQLPGPSEIAIVADETANPAFVAADLLAQAEHGHGSQVLLVTCCPKLLAAVEGELAAQAPKLARGKHLNDVLEKGCILVLTEDVGEAIGIVEDYAPEHLSLVIKDAHQWSGHIRNAGAIFIGNYSPVAAGDFIAGPSHVLPTGGSAKAFSGLTIDQFFRRTSIVEYPQRALHRVRPHIESMCAVEELDAHARSVAIRFDEEKK